MITALAMLVALAALAYLALGRLTRSERQGIGLEKGAVIAADDSRLRSPTLRSKRLGLVGRADHLLRSGNVVIPVEQKPGSRRLQPSHVMQVAAQCMLVQEVYGVRPPYGLLVLAAASRSGFSSHPHSNGIFWKRWLPCAKCSPPTGNRA
jgi:CRISPR-associated exonuclease Cas4